LNTIQNTSHISFRLFDESTQDTLVSKIDKETDNFLKMTQDLKQKFVKEYPKSAENAKNSANNNSSQHQTTNKNYQNFEKLFTDLESVGKRIQSDL
jgi:hypothetical protein